MRAINMDFSFSDTQIKLIAKFQQLSKKTNLDLTIKDLWKEELIIELQKLMVQCIKKEKDSFLNLVIAFEAISQNVSKVGKIFSIGAHFFGSVFPIYKFGSQEQKSIYLDKLLCGNYIGSLAITESKSGSDISSINTAYHKNEDCYTLSGEKEFITNAPICDLSVVFAHDLHKSKSLYNISAFIIKASDIGVEKQETVIRGLDGISIGQLKLSNIKISLNRLLSKEGRGLVIFNYVMQLERTYLLALLVGIMHRQIQNSVSFVNSRLRFNNFLSSFQSVSNRIVDMKVRLEASKLMLYKAAYTLDSMNKSYSLDIFSISKLLISEYSVSSSIDYFKTLGGSAGYYDSQGAIDIVDSLLSTTFSGTSDIQKIIIAKHMGLKI